jgi:quercetin dioxygenase-like cupin family protein
MSYAGDEGQVSAVYRRSAELPPLVRPMSSVRFVGPGSVTRGEFGLFRWEMKPHAGGPAAHFHRTFSESFYILSGRVRLFDGSSWVEAVAGDFLFVPRGGIHAFGNESDEDASMLILFAPGVARERYFQELAEVGDSGRALTPAEWTEFYARHDQYMVAPAGERRPS